MSQSACFYCSTCDKRFSLQSRDNYPYLLNCCHSICGRCFEERDSKSWMCIKCNRTTEFTDKLKFPFYLIGLLFEERENEPPTKENQKINFCSSCAIQPTAQTCNKCKILLCNNCFKTSHLDKIWKSHKLINKDERVNQLLQNLEESCLAQNEEVDIKETQIQQAKEFKIDLNDTIGASSKAFENFQEFQLKFENAATETIQSIAEIIANLCASLQVIGWDKVHELKESRDNFLTKFGKFKSIWNSEIDRLKDTTEVVDFLIEEAAKNFNIKDILRRLEDNLPDTVELHLNSLQTNPFQFSFDKDLFLKMKKSVNLTIDASAIDVRVTRRAARINRQQLQTISEGFNDDRSTQTNESSCFSDDDDDDEQLEEIYKVQNFNNILSSSISLSVTHQTSSPDATVSRACNAGNEDRSRFTARGSNGGNSTNRYEIPSLELVQYSYFKGRIVHFVNFNEFYAIKVESQIDELDIKMKQHFSYANNKGVEHPHNGFVCAVFIDGFWRRAVMKNEVRSDSCVVFLVDLGTFKTVKYSELMKISATLCTQPRRAIKCCLADVKLKEEHVRYPAKAVKEFTKLAITTPFTVEFLVTRDPVKFAPNPVVVYVFPNNGKQININAVMVSKFNFAVSTGEESREMVSDDTEHPRLGQQPKNKEKEVKEKKTRMEMLITHIDDPKKFYCSLKHRMPDVDRLHFEVQKEANQLTEPAKQWTIGESCLVFCVLNMNSPECWFRARVESVDCLELVLIEVFLIDIGLKVLSELKNLRTIPDKLMRQSPAAIKMHMPGVSPTGGRVSWTVSSIEMFQNTVDKFESICVSIVGDSDENGSLPVVVWGVTEEGIAMRPQRQFHNIMAFLHERGYIDYNVKELEELMKQERPISDKHFGWTKTVLDDGSVEELAEESDQESSDDDYEEQNIETAGGMSIKMVPKAITSWLASDADISDKFIGYATNVDDNGVIFVQNEEQRSIAQDIAKAINDVYSKILTNFSAKVTEGQAVIVHNKIDGGYYRAQVENLPKGSKPFKVFLVDYGTIELVERSDIYTEVVAYNIPMLMQKFRLSSVVPLSDDNEWPEATLNFLHGEIVDFKAIITVNNKLGDVHECSIVVLNDKKFDIEKVLVHENLAALRKAGDAWPPTKKLIEEPETKFNWDDYKRMKHEVEKSKFHERLEKFDLPAVVNVAPEETLKFIRRCEENLNIETSRSSLSFKSTHSRLDLRSSSESEQSYEIRPRRKHRSKRPPKLVSFYDLQAEEVEKFTCTFANCNDLPIVHITPNIPELMEQTFEMEKSLAEMSEISLMQFSRPELAVGKLCLVKTGGVWKRGQIIGITEYEINAEIFLLDSATSGTFKFDQVRKMPMKIRNFPKQTLAVVLAGITVAKHADPGGIFQLLPMDKQMTAVVKGFNDKEYPLVDLFINTHLAYQSLIDKNYFIKYD